jgi:NAD(P)-dependent dehydrogenase (short-subunit alcohol dehydrogenase family)
METDSFVAIVTGASRGLGKAMAEGLAAAGHRVVATARNGAALATLERAFPDAIIGLSADVRDEETCRLCVRTAVSHFGRLDILVNNAGLGMRTLSENFLTKPTKFWQADPAAWRALIDTNVNGPFLMARAAVPVMLEAGWGRIVNVSMNFETMRRPGFSPYGPSKAALEAATSIWAQELADTGISVNALLPGGATLTGMIPPAIPDRVAAGLLAPQIIVPPLLYLASRASNGVTGRRFNASLWPASETTGWPP